MIVPRPRVTPVASLAGKSTSVLMRVSVSPNSAGASAADAVVAAMSEMLENDVFGEYLDSPSTVKSDPGGATALR